MFPKERVNHTKIKGPIDDSNKSWTNGDRSTHFPPRGGRNKVLYEEDLPRDPTPYSLVCHFDRKDTPFVFLVH